MNLLQSSLPLLFGFSRKLLPAFFGMSLLGAIQELPAGETWQNTNLKAAASVLGQADFTSGSSDGPVGGTQGSLDRPGDVAVDPISGSVFVADGENNRVLRYTSTAALQNGSPAAGVLGQADFTTTTASLSRSRMNAPGGVFVDEQGRLWVSDSENNRVLRFDNAATKADGANADGVLGQPDFDSNQPDAGGGVMEYPRGLFVTGSGTLWVADAFKNRVLGYDDAVNLPAGSGASFFLGQPNIGSTGSATTASGMFTPTDVALDSEGNLWVADSDNNRVLRFDDVANKNKGAPADAVLGQSDFTSNTSGTSSSTFQSPTSLAIDSLGTVWVADSSNHRILRFDDAASKGDGAASDGFLGEDGTTQNTLMRPSGLFVDNETRLWVADLFNHRVLRFQANRFQPDGHVGTKKARQKGNNRYNRSGAGQKVTTKLRGKRSGKVFFTIQNDGDVPDNYRVKATRGNRKLKVIYRQTPGGNVTGAITRGKLSLNAVPGGSSIRFKAIIKGTRASRGKRATRNLKIRSTSLTDGETDAVKARVKKTP